MEGLYQFMMYIYPVRRTVQPVGSRRSVRGGGGCNAIYGRGVEPNCILGSSLFYYCSSKIGADQFNT